MPASWGLKLAGATIAWLILSLSGNACGQQPAAAVAIPISMTVTLSDGGCQYQGPARFRSGDLVVHVSNQTGDRMWIGLHQLSAGHSYQELVRYLEQERGRQLTKSPTLGPPEWASVVVDTEAPAHSSSATLRWTAAPATYAFACGRHG